MSKVLILKSEEYCPHCEWVGEVRAVRWTCPECGEMNTACNACTTASGDRSCGDCVEGSRFREEFHPTAEVRTLTDGVRIYRIPCLEMSGAFHSEARLLAVLRRMYPDADVTGVEIKEIQDVEIR